MGRKLPQEIEFCLHLGLTPHPLCTPKPDAGCLQHGASCPHLGKKPLVRWRKYWHPTTRQLEQWDGQGVNWGISCGVRVAALDFDKEEDFQSFLQAHAQASSWHGAKNPGMYEKRLP